MKTTTQECVSHTVTYQVRVPIYGYSGMGYESRRPSVIVKTFLSEADARRCARRFSAAWRLSLWNKPLSASAEEFYREMTDEISYAIKGPPVIDEVTATTTTKRILG